MTHFISIATYIYALVSAGFIGGWHDEESWIKDTEYEHGGYHMIIDTPAVVNYSLEYGNYQWIFQKYMKEGKVTVERFYRNSLDIPKEILTDEALAFIKDWDENANEYELHAGEGVLYFKYEGEEKGYVIPMAYAGEIMFVPDEDAEKALEIINSQKKY
ncbi:gp52 [Bacillus phage SPO1]|uniref:Putative gene 52 protein n=3 Tax=Bacillus phage SP01 TaxID=2884427 RepID=GP52_BPSP1|nr:gp52 [Bacillus phage SPO1]O48406.1 RecName: Full=Putative gene 52 protein [Bacillus phage SPO1]AAC29021.1 unknown [Bacillus phage SPO1]ACI90925.1 gp52 [Bacillus phage SPO1]